MGGCGYFITLGGWVWVFSSARGLYERVQLAFSGGGGGGGGALIILTACH